MFPGKSYTREGAGFYELASNVKFGHKC